MQQTFVVLVLDMARHGDAGRPVDGFPDEAAASAYAEARIRASVEELRSKDQSAAALRSLWHLYGEDCLVLGGRFRGSDHLDRYVAEPATGAQCDWAALAPRAPAGGER